MDGATERKVTAYLCTGEPFDHRGEEKIKWERIGEVYFKDGQEYAKIYATGQTARVFSTEQK